MKLRMGENFRLELQNRFSLLQRRSDPQPETEWHALKSASVEAAHIHLGVTLRRYWDRITGESLQLVEKARVARLTGAENFRDLRRRATHSICADWIAHWGASAEDTKRPAAGSDSRKLYQIVQILCSRDGAVIASLSGWIVGKNTFMSCSIIQLRRQ